MKIRTRLIASFFIFGLLMSSVMVSSWILFNQVEGDVDKIVEEHSVVNDRIGDLSNNIYQEQGIINDFIAEDNLSKLDSIESEYSDKFSESQVIIEEIMSIADKSIQEQLSTIEYGHYDLNQAFEIIKDERFDNISLADEQYQISQDIKNKRHEILDSYLNNASYTDMFKVYIPFTYEHEGTHSANSTVDLIYITMKYHEKEYLWQYMDKGHFDEWLEDIDKFIGIIDSTSLAQTEKNDIHTIISEYKDLGIEFYSTLDVSDLEHLISHKWELSQKIKDKRHEFRDNYIRNTSYGDIFKVYIPFIYNSEPDNSSVEYIFMSMKYHEKEYLWQYKDLEHGEEFHHDVEKLKTIIEKLSISQSDKNDLFVILDDYRELVEEFDLISQQITGKIYFLENQRGVKIAEINILVDNIQIGSGYDDEEGLDYIIASQRENMIDAQSSTKKSLSNAFLILFVVTIFTIIIGIAMGVIVSNHITRPLLHMKNVADSVSKGDLDAEIEFESKDELGAMAKSFERMTNSLKMALKMVEKDDI